MSLTVIDEKKYQDKIREKVLNDVIALIGNDIDFYKQLGKPDNQHRDVINAFKDFRTRVEALKGGEQE